MRTGFFLPNLGPTATPENIAEVARLADSLEFDSLWVTDRLLMPTVPSAPFLGAASGEYSDAYRYSLDPLAVLTYEAARTSTIRLGTSVLNINYNPVVVGRTITTLDVLSSGRLALGVGIGWQPDEFRAAGADVRQRGRRADEFMDVLYEIWDHNPVRHRSEFFEVPESSILPKPLQGPRPPVTIGVNSDAGLERAIRLGCGIHPANPSPSRLADLLARYPELALAPGTSPEPPEVVVRVEYRLSPNPIEGPRSLFHGSLEQIADDVREVAAQGATETIFDLTYFVDDIDDFTALMDWLA